MNSIYQRALGADFNRLHPQIQRRFGFASSDGIASIGTGVMDEIWKGRFYTEPFLRIGSWRRIMFPETGRDIPFRIENYAFVDRFGRETVSWIRTFESRRPRRFDAYMVFSDARGKIVDYLGSHEHLAVDIDLSVDDAGGLRLRSGAQRFYGGHHRLQFSNAVQWHCRGEGMVRRRGGVLPHCGERAQQRLGIDCSAIAAASMSNGGR